MSPHNDITNPNENLSVPEWINEEYFAKILAKEELDYVKVLKFQPFAAIPPGENFTSVMIRVHMDLEMRDGSTKHMTYILKTMLDDDKGGSVVNEQGLFPKELLMYQTFLHAFEALYRDAGMNVQFAPKCIFTEQKGKQINFVLEDLGVKNFRTADRIQGFDMSHMKRVLRKLAEFHAATAVYAEKHGPYPDMLSFGFINPNRGIKFLEKTYLNKCKSFVKAMSLWGLEDADKYIKKFPTFEQYLKCGLRTLEVEQNAFNVLIHGDLKAGNIMFNYSSDGGIDDLLFVDYQLCKWGSPAEDLLFFIAISAAKDIRVKEFDSFIEIYYERLIECLKLLQYKKPLPKLRELHMSLYNENTSFYAFFAVFNHLVVILLPTDKDSNLHSLIRSDEIGDQFRMRAFTNPLFMEAMKDLFPFFHKRGLFNFEDYE